MGNLNLQKEWFFTSSEIKKEKSALQNVLKKQLLYLLQILLVEYEDEKNRRKKLGRKEIYLRTKKFYLK